MKISEITHIQLKIWDLANIELLINKRLVIKMDKTIKQNLEKKLRNIFDDDEFVTCIFAHLKSDYVRNEFIKYIEHNPQVTSEELTLMSISVFRDEW